MATANGILEPEPNYWLELYTDPDRRYLCESYAAGLNGDAIIDRELISTVFDDDRAVWIATQRAQPDSMFGLNGDNYAEGPTRRVAAMRCFVAAVLGDEINIPDELCREIGGMRC